jgi:hypothetical protein
VPATGWAHPTPAPPAGHFSRAVRKPACNGSRKPGSPRSNTASAEPVERIDNRKEKSRAEHVAEKAALVHDGTGGYGENLYTSSSSEPVQGPATAASDAWYGEIKFYNYETFASKDPKEKIGHFTQLVWKPGDPY